ncbi:MAG: molybdopterin-dependent oxidoreductase, partial [Arenicellales bacterium]|nr:molybdopterin-dependent oxidoreductase [Arenicellales bacterium]
KRRLSAFAAQRFSIDQSQIHFSDSSVHAGDTTLSFAKLVELAYLARVQLSATGFYRTPKIHYNRKTAKGRPLYYYAYGAAVSE